MKKMTEENLKNAYAGESQAHMKYLAFADKAENDDFPNVARLFRANAFAEQVHATNHLRPLGGIGKTEENLQTAV
ncbi:MAG: rubrerythrin family protein, partial [Candidatus Aminicenantales bacterium]